MQFHQVDVTKRDDIQKAYDTIQKDFKVINYVINCAGVLIDNSIEKTIGVNTNGVIFSTLIAREFMRMDRGGRGGIIVNVSSVFGLYPMHVMPIYVASKHAVTAFTRAMGHDFNVKQTGIKCITICPGVTETQLLTDVVGQLHDVEWGAETKAVFNALSKQKADAVGGAVVHAIKNGTSGSVWICEGNVIREAELQDAWHF